jgi:uncharacterized surface protein with fasciclin (FAS1) repeats
MKYFKSLFIITLAAMTIVACDSKSQEENDTNEQGTEAYESANERMSEDRMAGEETIVSVASNNQNLSTLVKAVQAAGRVQMLNDSTKMYTVFAPTNEAFNALPEGTVDDLMKPENKQKLADILAVHVVEGSMKASDLEDGQTLTSVQGTELKITKKDGSVMVNGVKVAKADVKASNGTVHVIGKVLMPSGM